MSDYLEANYKAIELSLAEKVLTLTLNRPEAANGLNLQMACELKTVAQHCRQDSRVRVLVITGSGKFFCAGGDVKTMHDMGDQAGVGIKEIADNLHSAISMFARMPQPLVTMVNGTAAGAGFSIAICSDYAIAKKSAKFTMAYTGVGLSPDGSSSYFMPRLIGLRGTQDLMLTNRVVDASEAMSMGLISKVVEDDMLEVEANKVINALVRNSPESNASIKQLLLLSSTSSLETQLEAESQAISACASSKNGLEGISAFVEKRKPKFSL